LHAPLVIDAFPDLRVQAESVARETKQNRHGDCEVTLDEIYETFAGISGAGPDLIALLKTTELELERTVVYPNPQAKALFEIARAERKTIILCSDMYLPAAEVDHLLRSCGYEGYDALYVSCEHARSKHNGTIYSYVAAHYGVDPSRVLHFGDNKHGDCAMAARAGCGSVHLPLAEIDPVQTPWSGEQDVWARTVTAIVQGIWRKRLLSVGDRITDPFEQIGFRVFGPLFTGFLLWLKVVIEQNQPDKVLLLARDTHFIFSQLRRLLSNNGRAIDTQYVYVSRGALLLPSFTDFPLQRLYHLFSGKVQKPVASHLRRLGLEPNVLTNIVRSVGYDSLEDVVFNGDPRMHVLLGKLQQLILRESAIRRPLARQYLEQFVGQSKNIMLVDIGWVGNMQASFLRLLGSTHPDMALKGYYIGLFRAAADNEYPGHSMQGWLTNRRDSEAFERTFWWSGGVELLEFAMTAPHGTTLRYRRGRQGDVEPVLESNDADRDVGRLAARLQNGAAQFVDEFLGAYGDIPADGLNSRAWAAEFYRLVSDPDSEEADLIGDVTHSDAAGDTSRRLPLAPKVKDRKEALEVVAHNFWKAGFIVRNGLEKLANDEEYREEIYLALNPDVHAAVENGTFSSGHEHWMNSGGAEGRRASWAAWIRGRPPRPFVSKK